MSDTGPIRQFLKENRWCFLVRLQPGASSDRIAGIRGEALKVQVSAPPLEGRANQRLVEFLAHEMGINRSRLEIVAGLHSQDKTVAVSGIAEADLSRLLQQFSSRSNRSK